MTPATLAMWRHAPVATAGNPSLPLVRSLPHACAGRGHGGPRNNTTSRSAHPWALRPAALAGVQGCPTLTAPVPLVGAGTSNGWRKPACGPARTHILSESLHKGRVDRPAAHR
jgi:hypothetical protein